MVISGGFPGTKQKQCKRHIKPLDHLKHPETQSPPKNTSRRNGKAQLKTKAPFETSSSILPFFQQFFSGFFPVFLVFLGFSHVFSFPPVFFLFFPVFSRFFVFFLFFSRFFPRTSTGLISAPLRTVENASTARTFVDVRGGREARTAWLVKARYEGTEERKPWKMLEGRRVRKWICLGWDICIGLGLRDLELVLRHIFPCFWNLEWLPIIPWIYGDGMVLLQRDE